MYITWKYLLKIIYQPVYMYLRHIVIPTSMTFLQLSHWIDVFFNLHHLSTTETVNLFENEEHE